jgi:hypothetical protein
MKKYFLNEVCDEIYENKGQMRCMEMNEETQEWMKLM